MKNVNIFISNLEWAIPESTLIAKAVCGLGSKLPTKIMELLVEADILWLVNQEWVLRSEANYFWGMKSRDKGVRGKQFGIQGASKGKEQGSRRIESVLDNLFYLSTAQQESHIS